MGKIMLKYVLSLLIIPREIKCFYLCYSNTELVLCNHGILYTSHLLPQTIGSHVTS